MSASGKSTVLAELARRGHAVVDTDADGWIVDVPGDDGSTEPMWDEARISSLLDQHAGQARQDMRGLAGMGAGIGKIGNDGE